MTETEHVKLEEIDPVRIEKTEAYLCGAEKEEVEVWPGEPVLESLESKNC